MLHRAGYCHDEKSSVHPWHDVEVLWSHRWIRWNTLQIISWLISVFALCRPRHHGSTKKGTPPNFSRKRSGVWKNGWMVYKTCNISKTAEDRANLLLLTANIVIHEVSISAKMHDLEWPLSEMSGFSVADVCERTLAHKRWHVNCH